MKKRLIAIGLLALLSAGCNKHEETAQEKPSNDTLLSRPLDPVNDPVVMPGQDSFKQYIDPRRMRTPEHLAIMKRFNSNPSIVAAVYRDFRPLRKMSVTPESKQVVTFLKEHSITLQELIAILEEGDRLGWNKQ